MGSVAKVGWEGDANFWREHFFILQKTIDPRHQAESKFWAKIRFLIFPYKIAQIWLLSRMCTVIWQIYRQNRLVLIVRSSVQSLKSKDTNAGGWKLSTFQNDGDFLDIPCFHFHEPKLR